MRNLSYFRRLFSRYSYRSPGRPSHLTKHGFFGTGTYKFISIFTVLQGTTTGSTVWSVAQEKEYTEQDDWIHWTYMPAHHQPLSVFLLTFALNNNTFRLTLTQLSLSKNKNILRKKNPDDFF